MKIDVTSIITQLKEGININDYHYQCCDCDFTSLYDFRRHIYECHQEEYLDIKSYFHREKPDQLTKRERIYKRSKALRKKRLAKKSKNVRVKVDYSRQPRAWIIYNHNGTKII